MGPLKISNEHGKEPTWWHNHRVSDLVDLHKFDIKFDKVLEKFHELPQSITVTLEKIMHSSLSTPTAKKLGYSSIFIKKAPIPFVFYLIVSLQNFLRSHLSTEFEGILDSKSSFFDRFSVPNSNRLWFSFQMLEEEYVYFFNVLC